MRNLKVWDASTRSKDGAEREVEEQEVTIVQKIAEQWLTEFKCSVKLHPLQILLLQSPLLCKTDYVSEAGDPLLVYAQECSSLVDTSKFITPRRNHLRPIAVPGERYITKFETSI